MMKANHTTCTVYYLPPVVTVYKYFCTVNAHTYEPFQSIPTRTYIGFDVQSYMKTTISWQCVSIEWLLLYANIVIGVLPTDYMI